MKLAEIDITNQRHGVLEGTQYALSTDDAAVSVIFRTLVSGLYTNKKRAPLREYWTNALDESDMVSVHLPSMLDPRVVIRDYGPGLTHERVMHHFTKIGGSDKRDSNEKAGTLGYGSKSAFAYTNQFTIRSFVDGEVRVYIATMEKSFIPRLVHMHTAPTDEPNGLEISWNVKTDDINTFRREAQFVFFGAPERTIVKNENWKWPELDEVYTGSDFKVYYKSKDDESLFSGPYVRMGPVLYPLDRDAIGIDKWSQSKNWVGEDVLILDVPIGAVNIQDSREALGYDDRTIAYLKGRLEKARKEIFDWFQAEIDKIDHIIPAAHFLSKHRYKLLGRAGGDVRLWRGQTVPLQLDLEGFQISLASKYWTKSAWGRKSRYSREERRINLNFQKQFSIGFEQLAKPIDVFIDLGEKKAGQRILNAQWEDEKNGLWIKTEEDKVQDVLAYLNNPAMVTYVRDLPEPPKAPRYSNNNRIAGVVNVEVWSRIDGFSNRAVEEAVEGGWYLKREPRQSAMLGNTSVSSALVHELHDIGVPIGEIYVLSESKLKRKYFRKLKELTPEAVRQMVGPVDFVTALKNFKRKQVHSNWLRRFPDLELPADLEAIRVDTSAAKHCMETKKYVFLNSYNLLNDQDAVTINATTTPDIPDIDTLLEQRFPLLKHINSYYDAESDIQQYIHLMEKAR